MNPFESASILEDTRALDRVSGTVRDASTQACAPARCGMRCTACGWDTPCTRCSSRSRSGPSRPPACSTRCPVTRSPPICSSRRASRRPVPAAAAGLADFAEMHEQQRRVGVVHAAANTVALALYSGSLVARVRGDRGAGRLLGYLGLSVVGVSGYLGGHLAYRQAAGANHAEEVPHLVPPGWHDLCAVDDLGPAGEGRLRMLGEGATAVPLLVVRRGDRIDVLSNRCTHLAGPLHEGSVDADAGCVTCPWHGSVFSLDDGSVLGGPATAPAHAFDVRVEGGRLMVRLAGAG